MYFDVSPEYLYTMYDRATERRITGTINGVAFTGNDIIRSSLEVSNRCAEESDMKIGGVYIGQLNLTFVPSFVNKLAKKKYINATILVNIGMYVEDNEEWEDIPLGVFTVQSANISRAGITIEAYDNMHKFDKPFPDNPLYGELYDLLMYCCLDCGVELGVTRAFCETLANGQDELYLDERNDIETYRDCLYWVAQTAGAFATINRSGELELRQFGLGTTEMEETNRDNDAVYYDYVTKYTSVSFDDFESGETMYYTVTPDDGLCMNLGANPFLQTVADKDAQEAIAYLEGQIDEKRQQIEDVEAEIDLLDDAIEVVEAELEQHPDDPALLARLAQLKAEKESKEEEKEALEKDIEDLEDEIDKVERGIIDRSKIFKKKARRNVLREVLKIRYTPFYVNSARDPIFDLGDCIVFTGGMANGETGTIMSLDYKIDNYTFEGYGGNPELTDSRNRTDKSVTRQKKSSDDKTTKIKFVEAVNVSPITIREGEMQDVGFVRFGLEEDSDIETWVELKILTTFNEDAEAGILVTYFLDGEEITAYHPVEEWQDKGMIPDFELEDDMLVFSMSDTTEDADPKTHTVNLQYHLTNISSASSHTWKVSVTGLGGVEVINTECSHVVLWSQGLKKDNEWIGLIQATDNIPVYPINGLSLFGEFTEDVDVTIEEHAQPRGTASGDNRVTVNGDARVTV